MLDYTQFHQVFRPDLGSPYDQVLVREIDIHRKNLNGVLFIDRVLKTLGITKSRSYPPKGENGLHGLHQQICESRSSTHHKLSVFYYILLDFDENIGNGRNSIAENFAQRFGVPKKYEIFMVGLWQLDREQYKDALEDLAHPSLVPEFADDIITALVRQAEDDDYSLALAYYHTVQPVLKTSAALSHLFGAMARTSVSEALYFSRTQSEQARQLLFEQLISTVLETGGAGDGGVKALELVSLPLDDAEEKWFQDFLTTGDGRKLRKAKDTVLIRRVVTGRHGDLMGDKSLGAQWNIIMGGFKNGMGGRVS